MMLNLKSSDEDLLSGGPPYKTGDLVLVSSVGSRLTIGHHVQMEHSKSRGSTLSNWNKIGHYPCFFSSQRPLLVLDTNVLVGTTVGQLRWASLMSDLEMENFYHVTHDQASTITVLRTEP
jgi:hypothetical protein